MTDTRYDSLKAELEDIKLIADTQTHHHKLGQEYLYRGLAKVYLWWDKTSKVEGLLERIYDEYNLQYKKNTKHEIAFSPILRYLWDMDGTTNSNKIDLWNRCLNAVNTHYKNNKEYYKENAEEKIISFISASGGVSGLAGYQNKDEEDSKPQKNKISKTAQQKLTDAHLHNGKKFFANDAKPIVQLPIPNKLPLSDSGLTLGLLRKTASVEVTVGGQTNAANTLFTYTAPPAPPQPIPTLSEWAQIMMMLAMLATAGFYGWRMKQR